MKIYIKRVYDAPDKSDGYRVLADRLWPRGMKTESLKMDCWPKSIAPSTQLRTWFQHDPDKWIEFKRRYAAELRSHTQELRQLLKDAGRGPLTLLIGSRDPQHNHAIVLREQLARLT